MPLYRSSRSNDLSQNISVRIIKSMKSVVWFVATGFIGKPTDLYRSPRLLSALFKLKEPAIFLFLIGALGEHI